jgi:hypothetical protein
MTVNVSVRRKWHIMIVAFESLSQWTAEALEAAGG